MALKPNARYPYTVALAKPQAINFSASLPVATASGMPPVEDVSEIRKKTIPDPIYRLLLKTPALELHAHLSGSISQTEIKAAMIEERALELTGAKTGKPIADQQDWDKFENWLDSLRYDRIVKVLKAPNAIEGLSTEDRALVAAALGDPKKLEAMIETARDTGLSNYVQHYDTKILPFVKDLDAVYKAAFNYGLMSGLQNVRYVEPRIDPLDKGAPPEIFIRMVQEGLNDAREILALNGKRLSFGILITAKRHHPDPEYVLRAARETIRMKQEKHLPVVGFDIAGSESDYPIDMPHFKEAFSLIQAYNKQAKSSERIGITIHAGEVDESGPLPVATSTRAAQLDKALRIKYPDWTGSHALSGYDSMAKALEMAWDPSGSTPVRLGHGIHLIDSSIVLKNAFEEALRDPKWFSKLTNSRRRYIINSSPLLKFIYKHRIGLEMCPKSNNQTLGVPNFKRHPAVFLSRLGVQVSINTDNLTVSNTHLKNEFGKLFTHPDQHMKALHRDRKRMVMSALNTAFIFEEPKRKRIMTDVRTNFDAIDRDPKHVLALFMEANGGKLPSPRQWLTIRLRAHFREIAHDIRQWLSGALSKDPLLEHVLKEENQTAPSH